MNKYILSSSKYRQLQAELKDLETRGRKDIADKLNVLRDQSVDEEDHSYSDIFEDKDFLEKRVIELKEIISNSEILEESVKHKKVEIGSTIRVGFEGFEDEYVIVSTLEADPMNKKISVESPVGKALLGSGVGDTVTVDMGLRTKKFRVLKIS